jgi:hypothetical protein
MFCGARAGCRFSSGMRAGPLEIANVRVTGVEKNCVLVLNDGRAELLKGISMPLGGR